MMLRRLGRLACLLAVLLGPAIFVQSDDDEEEDANEPPTPKPTHQPTHVPTAKPSGLPTAAPTASPSSRPSVPPTARPTSRPTASPTDVPTALPSGLPTPTPTASPSSRPSATPTTTPTSRPTASPTDAPTSLPSGLPTPTPTASPSSRPSATPTTTPTSRPTASPTDAPTSLPSGLPTPTPTASPTSRPSATPTATPTSRPTASPTDVPTALPSGLPTLTPTASPSPRSSVMPTTRPTSCPTASPTVSHQPSSTPTSCPTRPPSAAPTLTPSEAPTASPTVSHQPSSTPTRCPTRAPSTAPTATPSGTPTVTPTATPSSIPTECPTPSPTGNPTALPSLAPSVCPSPEPTTTPTQAPTNAPTAQPSTLPTATPTRPPTILPTSSPTSAPTSCPTEQPTFTPSAEPTQWPTETPTPAPSNTPTTSPSSLPTTSPPSSRPSVAPTASHFPSIVPTQCPSLSPTTSEPSPTPTAEPSRPPTPCPTQAPTRLPTLPPSTAPTSVPSNLPTTTHSPSSRPSLTPTDTPTRQPSPSPTELPTSGQPTTNLPSSPPTLAPTGPSSIPTSEPSATPTATCTNADEPPALVSAQFTDSGGGVLIELSVATDRAGYSGTTFSCSELVAFPTPAGETCNWLDDTALLAAMTAESGTLAGDVVTIVPGKLRVKGTSDCRMTTNAANATVLNPAVPLVPTIHVQTPRAVSNCSDLEIDASSTTGSGGRTLNYTWTISSTKPSVDLSTTLQPVSRQASSKLVLPRSALAAVRGHYLVVNVTARNFFGHASLTHSSRVYVAPAAIPDVAFAGSSRLTHFAWQETSIFALASASTECLKNLTSAALNFTWIIASSTSAEKTRAASTSADPRYFELPAYSLHAGHSYEITATVEDSSGLSNSATLELLVRRSELVAVIAGGDRHASNFSTAVQFDASSSFDPDNATARLAYEWSCDDCQALVPSSSPGFATMSGAGPAPRSHIVAVTVISEDGRNASASVSITFLSADVPSISLNVGSGTNLANIDPSQRFSVLGTVSPLRQGSLLLSWSIENGELSAPLESVALTPLSKTIKTNATIPLTLEAGALVPGGSYTFSLSAGFEDVTATTLLRITCNTAPSSGRTSASPRAGQALLTKFTILASGWVDDDVPLRYTFYQNGTDRRLLRAGKTYATSLSDVELLAGPYENNYTNTVSIEVCDVYGASALASTRVYVHPLESSELSSVASEELEKAIETGDVDVYYRVIDVAFAESQSTTQGRRTLVEDVGFRTALMSALTDDWLIKLDPLSSLDSRARFLAILQSLTTGQALTESEYGMAMDLATRLSAAASEDGLELTSRRSETSSRFASVLSTLADATSINSSISRQAQLSDAVDAFASATLVGALADQDPEEIAKHTFQMSVWRASSADELALSTVQEDANLVVTTASVGTQELDLAIARYGIDVHPAATALYERQLVSQTFRVKAREAVSRRRLSEESSATVLVIDAALDSGLGGLNSSFDVVCTHTGNVTVPTCGNATIECDGSGDTFTFSCQANETRTYGCARFDVGTGLWMDAEVANVSSLACIIQEDGDYSATSTSVLAFYVAGLKGVTKLDKAIKNNPLVVMLIVALTAATVAAAIVGHILDVHDRRRAKARVYATSSDGLIRSEHQKDGSDSARWTLAEVAAASMPTFAREIKEQRILSHAARVVWRNHSILTLFTVYKPSAPRPRRAVLLLFSLLIIMMSQICALWLAFPIGYCEAADTRDACEAKKDLFLDLTDRFALSSQMKSHGQACKWSSTRPVGEEPCQLKVPKPEDIGAKRVVLVFLVFALSLPCLMTFDSLFTSYVCASIVRPWWAKHSAVLCILKLFFDVVEPGSERKRHSLSWLGENAQEEEEDGDAFDDEGDDGGAPPSAESAAVGASKDDDGNNEEGRGTRLDILGHTLGLRMWRNMSIRDSAGACRPLNCEEYYALRALLPTMRILYLQRLELKHVLENLKGEDEYTRDALEYLLRDLERDWGISGRIDDNDNIKTRAAEASFARTVYERLTRNLGRARAWHREIEVLRRESPFDAARIVFHLMRCEHLTSGEHRLLMSEVKSDEDFVPEKYKLHADRGRPVALTSKLVASLLCIAAFLLPVVFILVVGLQLVEAGKSGRRTNRLILVKTFAFILFTFGTLEPISIIITKLVIPATIYHKLFFYEDPSALRVPFATPLSVEPCALTAPAVVSLFEKHCDHVPARIRHPRTELDEFDPQADEHAVSFRAPIDDLSASAVIDKVVAEAAESFERFASRFPSHHHGTSGKGLEAEDDEHALVRFARENHKDVAWNQSRAVNFLSDLRIGLEYRAPRSAVALAAASALFLGLPPLFRGIAIREAVVFLSLVIDLAFRTTILDGASERYLGTARSSDAITLWAKTFCFIAILFMGGTAFLSMERSRRERDARLQRAVRRNLGSIAAAEDDEDENQAHQHRTRRRSSEQPVSFTHLQAMRRDSSILSTRSRDSYEDFPSLRRRSTSQQRPSWDDDPMGPGTVYPAYDRIGIDRNPLSRPNLAKLEEDEQSYLHHLYESASFKTQESVRRHEKQCRDPTTSSIVGRFVGQIKKQLLFGTRELRGTAF